MVQEVCPRRRRENPATQRRTGSGGRPRSWPEGSLARATEPVVGVGRRPAARARASHRHHSLGAQEPPQPSVEMRAVFDFAFPQSQYFPSQAEQLLLVRLVSAAIPCQLREPVLPPNGRKTPTVGAVMLVPEATVDEDHFAAGGEHEVRATRQIPTMKTKAIAQPMRPPPDRHLNGRVLGWDRSHDPAPLGCHRLRLPGRTHGLAPPLAHQRVGKGDRPAYRAGAPGSAAHPSPSAGRSNRRTGEAAHDGDAVPRNEIKGRSNWTGSRSEPPAEDPPRSTEASYGIV